MTDYKALAENALAEVNRTGVIRLNTYRALARALEACDRERRDEEVLRQIAERLLVEAATQRDEAEALAQTYREALPYESELQRLREHAEALAPKKKSYGWRHFGQHIVQIADNLERRRRAALAADKEAPLPNPSDPAHARDAAETTGEDPTPTREMETSA